VSNTTHSKPDQDVEYSLMHEIDLSEVTPFVAKVSKQDDVFPVIDFGGAYLDGCFIRGSIATEQVVILDALVLD
jgi:homoaconitase/3-isopropylmalate dehydratase large subunit